MAGRSDELAIQNAIRIEHGSGPARLWRNNTGALKDAQGRLVRYGLCPGSSDLIGLRTRVITEADLGHRFAQFVAIEVKDQGRLTTEQERFIAMVQQAGGLAGVARSPEDARAILQL
jgi:hypothetical protein